MVTASAAATRGRLRCWGHPATARECLVCLAVLLGRDTLSLSESERWSRGRLTQDDRLAPRRRSFCSHAGVRKREARPSGWTEQWRQVRASILGSVPLSWRWVGGADPFCVEVRDLNIHGDGGQWRSRFTSRPVSPRGLRRLLARWGWLRHHLHPPAWAVLDVRVVRPRVRAVVPVGLGRGRGRWLDILRGSWLDHHGWRGIVGVGRAPPAGSPPSRPPPPANASANEYPRAPVPPAAAVEPAASPPSASAVEPGTPLRGSRVPPAAAVEPAGAPARRLGGEDRACHQQPCRHDRPDYLLHGQSPCAVPERGLGLFPIPAVPSRAAKPHVSAPRSPPVQSSPP